MPAIIFPNTPAGVSDQEGGLPTLPNPHLEWIINHVHRVAGDDPRTPAIEGKVNQLAKALLENDRALLDYISALESYIHVYQAALNALGPGPNRFHADNSVRGVHQDISLQVNLQHQDSLVYGDTFLIVDSLGQVQHDDWAFTGNHADSTAHGDLTVVHSDFHSDHTDHFDALHGDFAVAHTDHGDHSDISHANVHGDQLYPYQDVHSDHTDYVHANYSSPYQDVHSDHTDLVNRDHCDQYHADHGDNRTTNIPHANVSHDDYYHHVDEASHEDYIEVDSTCGHWDTYAYHADGYEYIDYMDHTDCSYGPYFQDHGDYTDHANYIDHANVAHQDSGGHTDTYQDHANVAFCNDPHLDHNDHQDIHTDIPGTHGDHSHYDHYDQHTDVARVHADEHGDQGHQDYSDHANISGSHLDSSHLDATTHSDQHNDIRESHTDHSDHADHGDISASVVHQDGLVHGDSYTG